MNLNRLIITYVLSDLADEGNITATMMKSIGPFRSSLLGFPSLYHRIFSFPHFNNQERTCVYALLQKFYWSVNLSRRIGKSYGAGQQQPRQTSASVFGRPITIYPSFEGLAYLVVIVRPTRITPIHHYYY